MATMKMFRGDQRKEFQLDWTEEEMEEVRAWRRISPGKLSNTMGLTYTPRHAAEASAQTEAETQGSVVDTTNAKTNANAQTKAKTKAQNDVAWRPDAASVRPAAQHKSAVGAPIQRRRLEDVPVSEFDVDVAGSGEPLPDDVRAKMEAFLGMDFSDVRVHVGPQAASVGALAFTRGTDIFFAPGQYQPRSQRGQELIGHEMTHVVQQAEGRVEDVTGMGINDNAGLEREADELGGRAASGVRSEVSAEPWGGKKPAVRSLSLARGAAGSSGVAQLRLSDTVSEQRDARGVDTPSTQSGRPNVTFHDVAEDEPGPVIGHDHGHLDDGNGNLDESLREDPTWADRLELAKWIVKLEAAELLRPDLVDGTSAYRHFLTGNGATRDIHYGRFIENDSSGQVVLASAIEYTRDAATRRHDEDMAGTEPTAGTSNYRIRTNPFGVGNDGAFPYPATENWQKAIGAHTLWIEAEVSVTVVEISGEEEGESTFRRDFDIAMTMHAEDMYNFNPGDADITTGTPDAVNGRFEIVGLGHEYLNTGTYSLSFEFSANMDAAGAPGSGGTPSDPGRSSRAGGAETSRGRAAER